MSSNRPSTRIDSVVGEPINQLIVYLIFSAYQGASLHLPRRTYFWSSGDVAEVIFGSRSCPVTEPFASDLPPRPAPPPAFFIVGKCSALRVAVMHNRCFLEVFFPTRKYGRSFGQRPKTLHVGVPVHLDWINVCSPFGVVVGCFMCTSISTSDRKRLYQ